MGILRNLIDHTAARRGATTVKPDGGDDDEVTENIWSFLCPTPFLAVTKDEIINAIKNAYPDRVHRGIFN
jgi:hypothetical protein